MGKIRLEIEYDSDAKTAELSVNGGEPHQLVDASLVFEADTHEHDDNGWLVTKVTSTRLVFSGEHNSA